MRINTNTSILANENNQERLGKVQHYTAGPLAKIEPDLLCDFTELQRPVVPRLILQVYQHIDAKRKVMNTEYAHITNFDSSVTFLMWFTILPFLWD